MLSLCGTVRIPAQQVLRKVLYPVPEPCIQYSHQISIPSSQLHAGMPSTSALPHCTRASVDAQPRFRQLNRTAIMTGASSPPHRPRRKPRKPEVLQRSRSEALVRAPSFPLAAFLWPARSSSSQWQVLPVILMVVGLFRWAAGLWGYSGMDSTVEHRIPPTPSRLLTLCLCRLPATPDVWRL